MRRVLLTGASGKIGSLFYKTFQHRYHFTLVDVRLPEYDIHPEHKFVVTDLSDIHNIDALFEGITDVIHLAGIPTATATFQALLPANILSTTYLMDAAARFNIRRFVFASSAQTIEGYPVDQQINATTPVNPANIYGVTKCYGEALGAYYANSHQLSVVALRIAAFEYLEDNALTNKRDLSAWLSPNDAMQLLEKSLESESIQFFIGFGISNNSFKRFDLTETTRVLGYQPVDDAFNEYDLGLIKK